MDDLRKVTLEDFADRTWSAAPAPGGGAVAAFGGALGAALAGMTANLTVGKKTCEAAWAEMEETAAKAADIRERLLDGVNADAAGFSGYMAALKLPKDTEEQRKIRSERLQEELWAAAQVPLKAAETAMEIFDLAEAVVRRGNPGLVTDGLIAAMEAKTAVWALILNVRINLDGIRDRDLAGRTGERCDALMRESERREKEILALSQFFKS
jgi:formiminotetrahydrofolate cyclodeaminase